ncbi:MAG: AAA family ATPase [Saprospiraceae bacterium]|nr:AAA family ATPase [Saprospiraceae bacterium]
MDHGVVALGFGEGIDFSGLDESQVSAKYAESLKDGYGAQVINYFKNYLKIGNYVIISKGNHYIRAIGKVTGEYYFDLTSPIRYHHFRKVEWIFKDQEIPIQDIYERNLSQQSIYKLNSALIKRSFFVKSSMAIEQEIKKSPPKYVLVIDEINRGNVASIFGELITLIEPDKRAGNKEALEVVLPYSKQRFSVPPNLYIIGTMNTADRSIEALDTALRRRFSFKEMAPDPELIKTEGSLKSSNGMIDGIDVVALLSSINDRIEKLIDKDHKIGHADFMYIETQNDLILAFKDKVIPMLEEYFFGDYGKIGLVLGDSFVAQSSTDRFTFANFNSYDSQITQDLAERPIYTIKPSESWDFVSVYTKITKS